jgi:hypothetical protein
MAGYPLRRRPSLSHIGVMAKRMRKPFLVCGLTALLPSPGASQTVPEGIHRDATGRAEMCGLSGRDARELIERVRSSPNLHRMSAESDRFEVFESFDGQDMWALTLPSEAAYPAVTCRHFYNENGSAHQMRDMRCDGRRAACDRLFIEFRDLDQQMIDYIRSHASPTGHGTS